MLEDITVRSISAPLKGCSASLVYTEASAVSFSEGVCEAEVSDSAVAAARISPTPVV